MRRSTAKASATMTSIVSINASHTGTPFSISPTSVKAANSTITPWEKLNTPDALKMRTKPSATREYMTPVSRPLMMTSTRKTGNSHMSTNGATRNACKISMMMSVPFRRQS
jgi:hypothetical protein